MTTGRINQVTSLAVPPFSSPTLKKAEKKTEVLTRREAKASEGVIEDKKMPKNICAAQLTEGLAAFLWYFCSFHYIEPSYEATAKLYLEKYKINTRLPEGQRFMQTVKSNPSQAQQISQ